MSRTFIHNSKPSRRQWQALRVHLNRYTMTTPEALYTDCKKAFANAAGARNMLQHAVRHKSIRRFALYRNRFYWIAADENGNDRPLSEISKIRSYAMLRYCLGYRPQRCKLTNAELQKIMAVPTSGLPNNFFVDSHSDQPRLGFLRVDLGGRTRWDRILAKAKQDAARIALSPAFQSLVRNKRLEIHLVTALPQKAKRLQRALAHAPAIHNVPIRVAALPELINLIAPLPR